MPDIVIILRILKNNLYFLKKYSIITINYVNIWLCLSNRVMNSISSGLCEKAL